MVSEVLNFAVFPGQQGGPLEHIIAAKAVAFGEALSDDFKKYVEQVKKNADVMADAFVKKGYKVISGGTDNHLMLIDLRTKFPDITGKVVENTLVKADITINKNMHEDFLIMAIHNLCYIIIGDANSFNRNIINFCFYTF